MRLIPVTAEQVRQAREAFADRLEDLVTDPRIPGGDDFWMSLPESARRGVRVPAYPLVAGVFAKLMCDLRVYGHAERLAYAQALTADPCAITAHDAHEEPSA